MWRWERAARWWRDDLPADPLLIALGEARSCLAALASSSNDVDRTAHFDRLLIELDFITGDVGPACSPITGTRVELLRSLEAAVDRLVEYGFDRLSLELLLVAADGPAVGSDHSD